MFMTIPNDNFDNQTTILTILAKTYTTIDAIFYIHIAILTFTNYNFDNPLSHFDEPLNIKNSGSI